MNRWLRRLRARLRYRRFESELRDEIETHHAMAEADLAKRGATPDEARWQSARQLGNVLLARESARRVWIAPRLESVWQDVCYAARTLRKSPGFAVTLIGTLTITTGLTTNFFALADGVLFRPWPVPDADRVVVVEPTRHFPDFTAEGMYLETYRYLRDNANTVDLMAANIDRATIESTPREPIRQVSGSYFRVLQLPIVSGRPLTEADDQPGHPSRVVVISEGLWRDRLGGGHALGQTLRLNDMPFTIVGIAGAGATDTRYAPVPKAWVPLQAIPDPNEGDGVGLVAGRLRDGATFDQADAEIRTVNGRFPPVRTRTTTVSTTVTLAGTALGGQERASSFIARFTALSMVPFLLLLLGCANVANLQLARGFSRRDEIRTRLALGASRARVVRQLLIDGLVPCLVAGLVSVLIAYVLPRVVMARFDPASADSSFDLTPNWRVYAFAGGLACLAALVSGLAPAMRATRLGAGPKYVGVERAWLRSGLLAMQAALSVMLVLAAGLLARGIQHATGAGLGFDAAGVTVLRIQLPADGYTPAAQTLFSTNLLGAAEAAGVTRVGAAANAPYMGYRTTQIPTGEGRFRRAAEHFVSPGYFEVLRIPVISGRVFVQRADAGEAVVNQLMAKQFWPGESPIGRSFLYEGKPQLVVGVVGDARTEQVDRVEPGFFMPMRMASTMIVPNGLPLAQVQALVTQLEPRATTRIESIAPEIRERLRTSITLTTLVSGITVVALVIATVGTFGVFAYTVGERTREIGVRMALGGQARDIAALLTWRMCRPLAVGLAVGFALAQPLQALVRSQLFGLSVHDPLAYALVIGALSLSACAALASPLRRALRVDPAVTLRHE